MHDDKVLLSELRAELYDDWAAPMVYPFGEM